MSQGSDLFKAITRDPRYQQNAAWGEPRPGHFEGAIAAHIAKLERNLETLRPKPSEDNDWKLKILIHTHDPFKAEARHGVPSSCPASHASVPRKFLSEFSQDPDSLAVLQYHSEPFVLWRKFRFKGRSNQDRFNRLLQNISNWDLYLAFITIDGSTKGKTREPLFDQLAGRVASPISKKALLWPKPRSSLSPVRTKRKKIQHKAPTFNKSIFGEEILAEKKPRCPFP